MPTDAPHAVDLARLAVPQLYFALLRRRFSGTLLVPQPDPAGMRSIVFRGGMPVWTTWVSDRDVLGPLLVEQGVLSASVLGEALGEMARTGRKLGRVLVEAGHLPPERLYVALRDQLRRKLLRTFLVTEGQATLTAEVDLPDDGASLLPLNVLDLVRRGVVECMPISAVRRLVEGPDDRPRTLHAAFAKYAPHFGWSADDRPILEALAKGTTAAGLADAFGERGVRVLAALAACAMVVVVGAKDALPPGTPLRLEGGPSERAAAKRTVAVSSGPAKRTPTTQAAEGSAPRPPAPPQQAKVGPPKRPAAPSSARPVGQAPSRPPGSSKPAPDASGGSAAGEDFEARLARYEALIEGGAHAFELLGVPLDAKRKDIRAAWAELSKEFHPDALASRGLGHLKERVANVFAALSEANLLLSDKEKRKELAAAVEAGVATPGGPDPTAMARAAVEAEMLAKEGDKLLGAGRFGEAAEKFAAALERTPDDPDLLGAHAYASYRAGPADVARRAEAIATLEQISAGHPKVRRPPYFAGLLHLENHAEDLALAAFERALAADPNFVDAERQARAIRLRRKARAPSPPPEDEGGGIFGRFRRRK